MKIFKKHQIVIIALGAFAIAAICYAVSFHSSLENVQRWSLFSGMFFGLGSGCLSLVALWISIQTFVKTNLDEKKKMENDAKNFIIENEEEKAYLPLCIIASAYDRHHHFQRRIYNAFNSLSDDMQLEVLKQLNYEYPLIKNNSWIEKSLSKIEQFIVEFDLGENILSNKKHYFYMIKYPKHPYDETIEFQDVYPDCFHYKSINYSFGVPGGYISFFDFLSSYIYAKRNNDVFLAIYKDYKPLNLMINKYELNKADETSIALQVIIAADSIAEVIMEKPENKKTNIEKMNPGDAQIETYEDRFLYSLMTLYNLDKYK